MKQKGSQQTREKRKERVGDGVFSTEEEAVNHGRERALRTGGWVDGTPPRGETRGTKNATGIKWGVSSG